MLNIKRVLLLGFILLLGSCASNPKDVWVDDSLKPNFDYLVTLFDKNDIKINYRKIKYIRRFPLSSARGFYFKKYKTIYINTHFYRWDWISIYDEIKIVILAHEIAHSQKIWHNSDTTSIMKDSIDLYITDIIHEFGIEQPIINVFKKN
jgi:hypothetical protein